MGYSVLRNDLLFVILQFLEEHNHMKVVHMLEKESGMFFNLKYFEEKVKVGDWVEVEDYLSGFTKLDENRYSTKIYFEIHKQKYLEALDSNNKNKALQILLSDLKSFRSTHVELYNDLAILLSNETYRENKLLQNYGEASETRPRMLAEITKLIKLNPVFKGKLVFPLEETTRLRTLVNQSLNWQHSQCKNPDPNPEIKTLYVDHMCVPLRSSLSMGPPTAITAPGPTANLPSAGLENVASMPQVEDETSLLTGNDTILSELATWMAGVVSGSSTLKTPSFLTSLSSLLDSQNPSSTSQNPLSDVTAAANTSRLGKRSRSSPFSPSDDVVVDDQLTNEENFRITRAQPVNDASSSVYQPQLDLIPSKMICYLYQGSNVTSMDFHPFNNILLLVATERGDVTLWDIAVGEKLVTKPFNVWNMSLCSSLLQTSFVRSTLVTVNRVRWSADAKFVGVAFSKNLVHMYRYSRSSNLNQHFEIEAHIGNVYDLAFAYPNGQMCFVTCGDDKLVKVWALTGQQLWNFEGHEAPVYSVCPNKNQAIQFVLSVSLDGKIIAWMYDSNGSRIAFNTPVDQYCTTMAYNADGTRLFSCGTSKDGESSLLEWNENEGIVKQIYNGLKIKSSGIVHFDISPHHYLAAGEGGHITFWSMNNADPLFTTDLDGALPELPRLTFCKDGRLLAVSTVDYGFKILANANGLISLCGPLVHVNSQPAPSVPGPSQNGRNEVARRSADPPRTVDNWRLTEIKDPAQCRVLTLPETISSVQKVLRLLYTNDASGIMAIGSKGTLKFWRWPATRESVDPKATTNFEPHFWVPNSGNVMASDVADVDLSNAVACLAMSNNDSYVLSCLGGKVSLFNSMTSQEMSNFTVPPPSTTALAFHPEDNNVIAIGSGNGIIYIYHIRLNEVHMTLEGHTGQISSVAFSSTLKIMVSACSDGQVCVWNTNTWKKSNSITLLVPSGMTNTNGDIRLQFHCDGNRLLIIHETQLAIYDTSKMERITQWVQRVGTVTRITCATYSCDNNLIYATFCDGHVVVLDGDYIKPRCLIFPSAYLSPSILNGDENAKPVAIAANPIYPNQFAIGLENGSIEVIEPTEAEMKWGTSPPMDTDMLAAP